MFLATPENLSQIAVHGWSVLKWLYNVNGQQYWAMAMAASAVLYVLVSLLGKRRSFDLDRLLHRGRYDTAREMTVVNATPSRGLRMLGMGREFTRGDRVIYIASYVHTGIWILVFIVGTIYNLHHDVPDAAWASFWRVYFFIQVVISLLVIVWFSIGGFRDIGSMLGRLRVMKRDALDDGSAESVDATAGEEQQ
jgi:SSS family solute:Na+ symporter